MLHADPDTKVRDPVTRPVPAALVCPAKALRPARGILLGMVISAVFWFGVLAAWLW